MTAVELKPLLEEIRDPLSSWLDSKVGSEGGMMFVFAKLL